jgi:hypothetical protein
MVQERAVSNTLNADSCVSRQFAVVSIAVATNEAINATGSTYSVDKFVVVTS